MTTKTPSPTAPRERELTGRHVLFIALAAFGVILAANLAMVFAATSSFPGLVAKNSWVASQDFTRMVAAREELGWSPAVGYEPGEIFVEVTDEAGAPVRGVELTALVGRPSNAREDQEVTLAANGDRYVAPLSLAPGNWRIEVRWSGPDGRAFKAETKIFVSGQAE